VTRFVYTGALSREKGTLLLVETFSRLMGDGPGSFGPVELHLFGRGPKELLEKIAGIEGVHCHGQIENTVLRERLGDYDVFVFPSVYDNEGHPGSIIEALMAGLPVIACDRDVIREVVMEKVNGLLVEPGDGDTLLQAMNRLLRDPELRAELSEGASRTSMRYDADFVLPELAHAVGIK
jgi:glycosyltransferase involved in cell wall biosynthesis